MKVTRKALSERYSLPIDDIKQVYFKQLFIVQYGRHKLLISYYTIIGIIVNDMWLITSKHYSRTTAKQITQFHHYTTRQIHRIPEEQLNSILSNAKIKLY